MLQNETNIRQQKVALFSLAYCAFIIYGSLVPLDFRPGSLEQAWHSFQRVPYLNLGPGSRADWVANILLYIPLTFSLAAYFASRHRSVLQTLLVSALILTGSITLAVSIEFCQLFFPPRTVSQNDLIAETIGSIIGLILWFGYGKRLQELYTHILQGGRNALLACAVLYALAYFALSFFPYDFVTSVQELQNKLTSGNDDFFISASCGGLVRCGTKLVSEIVLTLPLGVFFSVLFKRHPQRLTAVMLTGFIFGAFIEVIQLFLISGIAQGVSVFTRIIGMGLGEILYTKISALKKPLNTLDWKRYVFIVFFPYVLLLASLNGWSFSDQQFSANITARFDNINWLPFYYHYYTSEAVALNSLLSIFLMYVPVGMGLWLWNLAGGRKQNTEQKLIAGLYAVGLCFVMETSKLFLVNKHPDPTNLIISFATAFITYAVADVMYRWFHQPETAQHSQYKATSASTAASYSKNTQKIKNRLSPNRQPGNHLLKSIAFFIFALLCWKILDYPGSSIGLIGMLLLYGIMLRNYPQTWLIAMPALLPVLDFSPWTGRIFFSEFDYFISLTLAISLWYGRWSSPARIIRPTALFLFNIYALFYLISMLKGLLPFATLDANAFANYYSRYNSLRVSKGLLWVILLLPLLTHFQLTHKHSHKYFTYGILLGLTATVLFGLWERYIFTGLFDYASDFRITSTFYSMHTGGAHLDAYLVLTLPFICILLTESTHSVLRVIIAPLLFSVSLYILLVTYSRGTYIAFVFSLIILIAGLLFCYKHQLVANWKKTFWLPLLIILIAVIATPILKGSFIQYRFSRANQEVGVRSAHWLKAMNMMDTDFFTTLFGMGLGSFPRTYLWKNFTDDPPATFYLQSEQGSSYIQLGSGAPLYIEQNIAASAYTFYKLTLDYRSYSRNSGLVLQICEKAVQHSFSCQGLNLIAKKTHNHWQQFEQTIYTDNVGNTDQKSGRYASRPIKLILHNNRAGTTIDVTNIAVTSLKKVNLIKNGNFSAGMDHWYFSADDHIPWRTENLWLQILFDQGWLGLIAFIVFLLYIVSYLYQQVLKQDLYALILLSSLTGFMIVGVVDSPFDSPKITLLFYLMLFSPFFCENRVRERTASRQEYRKLREKSADAI